MLRRFLLCRHQFLKTQERKKNNNTSERTIGKGVPVLYKRTYYHNAAINKK